MQLSMTALGIHCGYRFYRFGSLWASSMATCHPGKANGPFTIRALVHISTLKVLRQLSSFVRSVRSLNHTSLITWRFLPERYRYLQCAKAVFVCCTNRTALTTNLTLEEQRKRKSTINILQFYHYIRLLSSNQKTEDEVARIYPIRKYMSGGTSCRIIWINSYPSAI